MRSWLSRLPPFGGWPAGDVSDPSVWHGWMIGIRSVDVPGLGRVNGMLVERRVLYGEEQFRPSTDETRRAHDDFNAI